MRSRLAVAAAACALLLALTAGAVDDEPQDIGLRERTSTRLAQIDVTLTGPKDAILGLRAEDFVVKLNTKVIPGIILDDLCQPVAATAAPAETTEAAETPAPAGAAAPVPQGRRPVTTYLFYFDMAHLTQAGRISAIDSARDMLPRLVTGGNQAMIVANARALRTIAPLSSDAKALDAALEKMVDDNEAFNTYAAGEEIRLANVIQELSRGTDVAVKLAKSYAADERRLQERDLNRLSMVLGRLADIDPPKAALYFADTMRQNAGEHYLAFFSGATLTDAGGVPNPETAWTLNDAVTGALPLDRVMNEASSYGVRFYTIQGEGMVGPTSFIQARGALTTTTGAAGGNVASPGVATQRTRDAQGTLVSLASETGGRPFLNGVPSAKMATQIVDDLSCVYLLSFDPRGWPEDTPLGVTVRVDRPKVKVSARGRIVLPSEGSRVTGRVLSAFAAPSAQDGSHPLHVAVIPSGYAQGRFKARVQVAVPGTAVPGTTWDVGASLVSHGVVAQEGSGRISLTHAGVPVVWEKDMEFASGEYDIVAVAHERTTDEIHSKEVHGAWPNLEAELASLGPISVSQPLKGGFLRNGAKRTQGAVVVPPDAPLRAELPTAVVTLVCRAKDQKKPLRVVRTLVGVSSTPVGTTDLELGGERCGQVVDLIPAKTMGPGRYVFRVAVSSGATELTRGETQLVVPEPVSSSPAAGPASDAPPS